MLIALKLNIESVIELIARSIADKLTDEPLARRIKVIAISMSFPPSGKTLHSPDYGRCLESFSPNIIIYCCGSWACRGGCRFDGTSHNKSSSEDKNIWIKRKSNILECKHNQLISFFFVCFELMRKNILSH